MHPSQGLTEHLYFSLAMDSYCQTEAVKVKEIEFRLRLLVLSKGVLKMLKFLTL